MCTKHDIVIRAREYLGVKWHHQGRNHAGIDCAGLVICVAHDLGISNFDVTGYDRTPSGQKMRIMLDANMDRVKDYEPGDVLFMCFEKEPQHLAIVTDLGIIHALAQTRCVVEHRLDSVWKSRVVGAYAYRGLV